MLHERVQHHILKPVVDATDAAIALHENRFDEGLARAHAVLSDPVAPKQAVEFAAFGVGLTLPVAGRGHEFEPIAQRCRDDKKRTTDGLIAAMVRYCDVLALTYTGQLDLAEERVAEIHQVLFCRTISRLGDRPHHGRSGGHPARAFP